MFPVIIAKKKLKFYFTDRHVNTAFASDLIFKTRQYLFVTEVKTKNSYSKNSKKKKIIAFASDLISRLDSTCYLLRKEKHKEFILEKRKKKLSPSLQT